MAKNLMPEIAKLLGVEIGEEFKIDVTTYKFDEKGCLCFKTGDCYESKWATADAYSLRQILYGYTEIIKLPWKPKIGEEYWNVAEDEIYNPKWTDSFIDFAYLKLGNCFRTREEAKASADRIRKEIMGGE